MENTPQDLAYLRREFQQCRNRFTALGGETRQDLLCVLLSPTTCRFCRKEFNYFQSSFYCLCHFGWCHTSRENRNFFFQTVIYDFRIESRTYDEFCSCLNSSISHKIRFP